MENLHAKGPFRDWQRPCSVSSPLNSSSGCAENGKVACPAASAPRQATKDPFLKAPQHGLTRRQTYPTRRRVCTYKERLNRKIACAIYLRFLHRPVCQGAFSGLVALHVASSPLGNLCGCARTKKVNLSGRRCSRIAAKGPFPQALLAGSYAPESIPAGIGNM